MQNFKVNKKYGIIAVIVVIVLCILVGAGIHKHNEPISPVVGNWVGEQTNDYGEYNDGQKVKLQTYNNHTFALEIHYEMGMSTRFNGKYTGTWKKTDDVTNDGKPIYALKSNKSSAHDGYNSDEKYEYFVLGGKHNIIWIGSDFDEWNNTDNQELRAKLVKQN